MDSLKLGNIDTYAIEKVNIIFFSNSFNTSHYFYTCVEYRDFLKTLDVSKSKYLAEYLLFMDKFIDGAGNVADTQFKFNVIPVTEKLN